VNDDVVHFIVVPNRGGGWSVIESGFEMPLAEFTVVKRENPHRGNFTLSPTRK